MGFAIRLWRHRCGLSYLGPAKIGAHVFKAEIQLVGIKPLGLAAELAALQLADDQAEFLDLAALLLFRRHKVTHQLVQQLRIRREIRKIDAHEHILHAAHITNH